MLCIRILIISVLYKAMLIIVLIIYWTISILTIKSKFAWPSEVFNTDQLPYTPEAAYPWPQGSAWVVVDSCSSGLDPAVAGGN